MNAGYLFRRGEFEWLVGEVFRREGWKVRETGRQDGPDGNIDLELSRNGKRVIVQCKRWTSWEVGVDEIRAFGGTLLRENLPSTAGIFVTLSNFTTHALAEGQAMGLTLIDGRELFARIEKVRRVEPCPVCDMPMKLGTPKRIDTRRRISMARPQPQRWLRCIRRLRSPRGTSKCPDIESHSAARPTRSLLPTISTTRQSSLPTSSAKGLRSRTYVPPLDGRHRTPPRGRQRNQSRRSRRSGGLCHRRHARSSRRIS